jgi:hypothetical protein
MLSRPCKKFKTPTKAQGYGAFCGRCHYSRLAHQHWDEWEAQDNQAQREAADMQQRAVAGKKKRGAVSNA